MAKQTLPVNFKDDILNSSMGGKRRYNLIQNSNGTVSLEDVTSYTQVGSDFGAAQMNQTNKAVNESCDKANVIDDLDDIMANQASGMIAGAKAVAELNGKTAVSKYDKTVINFGSGWEVRHCEVHKIGNLVDISARIYTGIIMANTDYTIATASTGFRPVAEHPLCAVAGDHSMANTVACMCLIQTSGNILLKVPADGKTYIDISGTFITV